MYIFVCTTLFLTLKVFYVMPEVIKSQDGQEIRTSGLFVKDNSTDTGAKDIKEENPCVSFDHPLGGLGPESRKTKRAGIPSTNQGKETTLKEAIKGLVGECKSIKKEQSQKLDGIAVAETNKIMKTIDQYSSKSWAPKSIKTTDDALKALNRTGFIDSFKNVLSQTYFHLRQFCTKNTSKTSAKELGSKEELSKPFVVVSTAVVTVLFERVDAQKVAHAEKRGGGWAKNLGLGALGSIIGGLIYDHLVDPAVKAVGETVKGVFNPAPTTFKATVQSKNITTKKP